MATISPQLKRVEIPFFEGMNCLVGHNISKKQELPFIENARSSVIGIIEKREGYRRLGNEITSTANYGMYYFDDNNASSKGFYRVSTVSSTTSIYYLNTSSVWTALTGLGTSLSGVQCSFAVAESCCFVVNGTNNNRYISSDGITVVDSTTAAGHLYGTPKANKINFYKDRLYLADYTVGSTSYPTGIMISSPPLGIVSLVDGDHVAGATSIKVTDTKYIQASDTLQVYRGGSLIEALTVSAKTEDTITVSATSNAINSSDELWVNGSYSGTKKFRWASNPASGINVKKYDTFKLTGAGNDAIRMITNIGNVMMIANKENIGVWDDYRFKTLDLGFGCVSKQGYVKNLGTLFFISYKGMHATTGDSPKLISSKVDKIISGATTSGLEGAAMGAKGMSVFASIGNVTLYKPDGSIDRTLSNVVLEYNMQQENWYIHSGISASFFYTYQVPASNPDRLEFCGSSGHVYEMFFGTKDNNSDDIPFRMDIGPITLCKQFEQIAYPKSIVIESERGSSIQGFVSLDGGEFYEIQGESAKGCTILEVTARVPEEEPPRCRNLTISLREFSDKLCNISKVAVVYAETAEEESFKPSY